MKTKLLDYWESIKTSLWFVPIVMATGAVIFALALMGLDEAFLLEYGAVREFFYTGDPPGARLLLSSIAGSMITVAGVSFSVTMVALTLTTSQYGPRLLRNFMADRVTQIVLGAFIATSIYCLLVLRTIQESGNNIFMPRLAVSMSIVLVLADFGLLIYFFHHVSSSIHAENVIRKVHHQLEKTIDKIFGDKGDEKPVATGEIEAAWLDFEGDGTPVMALASDYVRVLDEKTLYDFALEHDLVIKNCYRPGDYVFAGTPLVLFLPRKVVTPEMERRINSAFLLGSSRSPEQDIEYSILQLVEVAVRALSPGINDPYTAMHCIDRLGAALCRINEKSFPSPYRHDDKGRLRLLLDMVTYDSICDAAFNQIRQYGRGNVDINIRLLEILHVVAATTADKTRQAAVRRHGDMVFRACREAIPEMGDRSDVEERYQRLMAQLQ